MTLSVAEDGLEFRRPFNQVVKQYIHLSNTATDGSVVAFKIKTTAPKQYCVRPNAGLIAAGGTRDVEVLLQAMKEDPPLDFKCKDKFLVQSITVPADVATLDSDAQTARLQELWARADEAKKGGVDNIIEKKLKCTFVGGNEGVSVPTGIPLPSTATPVKASPSTPEAYNTPAAAPSTAASDRELRDAKEAIKRLTVACEGYKSEIERLNQLRQRRTGGGADDKGGVGAAGLGQVQAQAQGLAMPLAIALALIAFILGAILF